MTPDAPDTEPAADRPDVEPDVQSDPALADQDESVDWASEGGAPVTGDESHDD